MTESAEDYAPSTLNMQAFRFIPTTYPRKERASTLDIVAALRGDRGSLIRWDRALARIARHLDVPTLEAEVLLLRALADPRELLIGQCSRRPGNWFVTVPRSRS
jgi:hypothetical protein